MTAPFWNSSTSLGLRLAHPAAAATGIRHTAPLALRVAIHQGTVFSTGEGLFVDAVNIAARLHSTRPGRHGDLGFSQGRAGDPAEVEQRLVRYARFAAGNMLEAVRWARLCRDENPGYTAHLRYLTAALVGLGHLAEARAVAKDMMRREPEFRLKTFARRRQPFRQPETGAAYLEGLRAAGLPD